MNLVIMQPYLFPYLGYVQLMHVAETFVIYDDAQFMKGGWINRNRILGVGGPQFVTLNLSGASANKAINEVAIGSNLQKLRKTIEQTYAKAPYADQGLTYIDACFECSDQNLAGFVGNSLQLLAQRLGLTPQFMWSSELKRNRDLAAEDAVLEMCKLLSATHYINAEGGQDLYHAERFAAQNCRLSFLQHVPTDYPQIKNKGAFEPRLSVIDAIMNVGFEGVRNKLVDYRLLEQSA